jgi:site-specific DNA recombinase
MNGVIYCRVSSKEQVEGTSLESQRLACEEYARANKIGVLKVFVEQGESAKFADRTQLMELLEFCREKTGKVQVLLVWKVDRFARNVGDHFNIKASLLKYGVRVVSATEPIDSNPEGNLMETILAGFAQFDNDIRAMRTVHGMRRKIQEGIFPWGPPFGYKSSVKGDEKKTEPDQPSQPSFGLLQKAWKEFAKGIYTKAEIRRLMTTWGIVTPRGLPLSPQSLDNLFRNPYYAGVLVDPWSGEEFEGKHLPIVSRQDFARVQQIVSRHNLSVPHQKVRPEFPLRGLVRCQDCGAYLTAAFSRGRSRRYSYYRCGNPKCGHQGGYRSETVHEEFEAFLDVIVPRPELLLSLGKLVVQTATDRQGSRQKSMTRRKAEIDRLRRETEELIRMRTSALITDDEFTAQKHALSDRRMAIQAALDSVPFDLKAVLSDIDQITKPLTELRQTWSTLGPALRSRFQRSMLPVGYVNGRIGTAERALFFRTLEDFGKEKTNGVPLTGAHWNQIEREIKEFAGLFREHEERLKNSQERFQEIQIDRPRLHLLNQRWVGKPLAEELNKFRPK